MADWAINLGYLVICGFLFLNGVLMLVSPWRHVKFMEWLLKADKWSQPDPKWIPGLELHRRLGGIAVAVLAVFMILPSILWMINPSMPQPAQLQPSSPGIPSRDWHLFGVGLVSFTGGIYLVIRPLALVHWAARKVTHRLIPHSTLGNWAIRTRILGTMMAVAGIIAIANSLKS